MCVCVCIVYIKVVMIFTTAVNRPTRPKPENLDKNLLMKGPRKLIIKQLFISCAMHRSVIRTLSSKKAEVKLVDGVTHVY